ncbi:carbon-nitrogen hydrolase family protein [Devosia psychrophila]|uniref:Predicted amidohydrolase n=1 Tax=Devosia psychrophila TaxID=728005 RepID=A0A0F5PR34_9HYPH|nr:carbon-nitrogen hydrolase family protein [Devosia psychrophila]KKC31045.1 hypothetical protein WH91_21485 [Devosia psychrophila]SFD13955.1 Predicted amidohydrolase [Devosia psychrophila]
MPNTIRIAVVQSLVQPDIAANGSHIRDLLEQAGARGAQLALFGEGALSGYVKSQITDWAQVDWAELKQQRHDIATLAKKLGIVADVGTATELPGKRPYNSLEVIPTGLRYHKRFLSNTEITDWYSPGFEPVEFELGNYRFGMTICIETSFPELFAAYEAQDVDCVLHATYGMGAIGDVLLRSHAATNCFWLAVATASNHADPASGIIGPDGNWLARCGDGVDIAVAELDRVDPAFDIALNKARPWRRLARQGQIYRDGPKPPRTSAIRH